MEKNIEEQEIIINTEVLYEVENWVIISQWYIQKEHKKEWLLYLKDEEIDFEKYNKWYDIFKENWKIVYKLNKERKEQTEKEKAEKIKKEKQEKIKEINEQFDQKIDELLQEYPKYERETFQAQIEQVYILEKTWKSEYLENLMKTKNLVREKFWKEPYILKTLAEVIKNNAESYQTAYLQLLVWKDAEVEKIKSNKI